MTNSKSIGADLAYVWPTVEFAVMGAQGAVEIVYHPALQQVADLATRRSQLVAECSERYADLYLAAERDYIDDVINPADTRVKLLEELRLLRTNRDDAPQRKHGNTPF